ncbi:hypothetical protein I316_05356 [Kwoniella heveanensis BCC8398]|uniref:DUF7729 domain-containing protein n=1 Tax=Kwoniella heveanensis BCC8398 TaxID=1296120 RepID=A0A1B9GPU5_9TREE|nr:hypothetical protein I316_05356 [Kwoniella heveanensis BCC8398]
MRVAFVLSLVLTVIGAQETSATHHHGLRNRHRRNDPAKRIVGLPAAIELSTSTTTVPTSSASQTPTQVRIVDVSKEEGDLIPPLPTRALPPEIDEEYESSRSAMGPGDELRLNSTEILSLLSRQLGNTTSSNTSTTPTLPSPPVTAPLKPPRPVPTPLDLSISQTLSSGCMVYLSSLLSSSTFLSCLPFSLLLTTSAGYSKILSTALSTGNYTTLNNLISYTASPLPGGGECESYMSDVMSTFSTKANCGTDLSAKKVVALEAKNGIGNYGVMREAEGLVDESTGKYCYIEAVASGRPDDLYLWGLASEISLPSSSTPTCSPCSKALLNTYTTYMPDTATLNTTLIGGAIQRVNAACGQGFVNLSATTSSSGAMRTTTTTSLQSSLAGSGGSLVWLTGLSSIIALLLL